MKYQTTATRLRLAMEAKNMKAQELADKAGIHKSSISQYVNGSHTPSNIKAGKMGEVLGVNPLWLMGFDVPMTVPQKKEGEMGTHAELMSIYINELEQRMRGMDEHDIKRLIAFAELLYNAKIAEEELK